MWRSIVVLTLVCIGTALGQAAPAVRQFHPGSIRSTQDLPASRVRSEIERLPADARARAIAQLGGFHFTPHDLNSLRSDPNGGVFYADRFDLQGAPAFEATEPVVSQAAVPASPFPSSLIFHSRPGAANVLFLNFSGDTISGTAWNTSLGRSSIPAVAFSTDGDYSTFSDSEQVAIKRIWQRISEDYAPFNIDVTTERPATFTTRTAHALITRNTDANGALNPSSDAGGVAYISVFATASYGSYRPAWIYFNNLAYDESYIAEAAAHEIGHNMGLSHDGTSTLEYYGGHGSGNTSWGPIMGTGYNRNVSQWSKGEYYDADNTQDDLSIISAKLTYRPDDHGNTASAATALIVTGTNIVATTPENDPTNTNSANKGVLERTTDVDVFSFTAGSGPIKLTVSPWISPSGYTRGGDIDISLELRDSGGTLLMTNNPTSDTAATIQTNLTERIYYLFVRNTGVGNPSNSAPSGYTSYGSLGQYFINGYIIPSGLVIPPGAQLSASDLTQPAAVRTFTVTYSDNAGIDISTIDGGDLRITGPNGYDRAAQLVSIDVASDGTPRIATYAAPAPNGLTWTEGDNGTYVVMILANQVSDIEGAFVPAATLGQFQVSLAHDLYFANMDLNPGWTFESQWQYGKPTYAAGTGPSAGFSGTNIIGFNLAGNYPNNLVFSCATTPVIDCSGASTVTLRFQRWLRLRNGDTAVIQVSTNGTGWTDVWFTTRTVSDSTWQSAQYTLPAWVGGSGTVRLRWGLASTASQNDIGWNIDDVEVLGGGSVDTTAPTATLSAGNITSAGAASYSFSVTYSDSTGVSVGSLGAGDLLVTGPNGYSNLVEFAGVDTLSDGAPRSATYSIPAPGGSWDGADNGIYQIVLRSGEVRDTLGNAVEEISMGGFTTAIATNAQSLVVSPGLTNVAEGGTATLTIRLAAQPSAPVAVSVARTGGDTDLYVVLGATNIFTPLNWATPVPVVIGALPDVDQENGAATFEIRSEGLAPITVTAVEQDNTPNNVLSVTLNNGLWGAVTPSAGSYSFGATVQVLAIALPYYRFVGWSGAVSSTNNPLVVTLSSNVSLTATFAELITTNHAIPQWWLAVNGYTNNFETAASAAGANGMALWQSYVAGLQPTNPASQLRINASIGANGDSVLNWQTASGRLYTISYSADPSAGYMPLASAVDLPASVTKLTNAVPISPQRYFRLEVRKPE